VALYAMLAVALSGVVGRFVYRHIHYGMYGAKVSIKDAQQCLKESGRHIEALFSLWHLVHVPFLYLLVLTGIVHVVAVHMY
jgi:hypothetical protein